MPLLPLLAAGASILGGVSKYNEGVEQNKRMGAYARKLEETTPNERDYLKRQRAIAQGGDPFQNQLMQEQMNRTLGAIRQTGAEAQQRTEGSIIGQGMENSIVAAELRRKTGSQTMRNIAEQSRRISAENRYAQEQTKRAADERMFQVQSGIDQRGFQAAGMKAQMPSQDALNMGLLGNIAQAGIGAATSYFGRKQAMSDYEQKLKWKKEYGGSSVGKMVPFDWNKVI